MSKKESSGLNAVGPVERQTLGDKIYESLRHAIIHGDLEPGQRVTERQLAQQMNVSTTPVREAFRRLSALGLITIVPWSGAVIEGISQEDIVQVSQCREVLEGLASRLAAHRMDDDGFERLQALIEQIELETDMVHFAQVDSEIHELILGYSGNSRLAGMLGSLNEIARLYLDLTEINEARANEMREEYKEILAALRSHDEERSEVAMRNHICRSFEFAQR